MKKIYFLLCMISFTACADGQNYTILGTINPNCYINQLTCDRQGNIYAACGYLVGAQNYGKVEKWNGSAWAELGTANDTLGANGDVRTVTTDANNNVFVAGDFNDLSGPQTGGIYVAEWNGSAWSEVNNSGNPHINNGTVFALTTDSRNNVYATEFFDSLNVTYSYVAEWNGTNWAELGSGNNVLRQDSAFLCLAHDTNNNIYVGGQFADSAGYKYVAVWNGINWSELGAGPNALQANGNILTLATNGGHVYAGGTFTNSNQNAYVAYWNGSAWADLGNSGQVFANENYYNAIISIAADDHGVYAAGGFKDSAGYFVAVWNGSAWSKLHTDTFSITQLAVGNGEVYGAYSGPDLIGDMPKGFVARLNISGTNAVQQLQRSQINLYPNPVSTQLFLGADNFVNAEVYNVLGEEMMARKGSGFNSLDVASLAAGLYLINLYDAAGNIFTGRFCKQ